MVNERMEERKDVEGLIKALEHGGLSARWRAAYALGRIGDARAVEPLTQALKHEIWHVRGRAALALDKLGWKPARMHG